MARYILAIDQGTTGSTAALINSQNMEFVDSSNYEFPQHYPGPSLVEHDLDQIWQSIGRAIKTVLIKNQVSGNQIDCIGITNQRETTCAFDSEGRPLYHAIVWQDRRTASRCQDIARSPLATKIIHQTGLPIDAYFSASKMEWLIKNQLNTKANKFFLSTIDSFLLFRLTQGKNFCTDVSNASRTMLMNLETQKWSQELLDIFQIKKEYLPEIRQSFGRFGLTKGLDFLPDGIPITGILGDQQSALFGQAGTSKGDIKCTYGTGAFVLLNTGINIVRSNNGLISTCAYTFNQDKMYALEGSSYIAGAAIQWLRDNLNFFASSAESESMATSIDQSRLNKEMQNVIFMPFFTGIGGPHWKQNVKATILGLTRDTDKRHITMAAFEGVAYSIKDLINAFGQDLGAKITKLKVDGGMSKNQLFLQIQSDILDMPLIRPKVIETTAYGAALAAAVGNDMISIQNAQKIWKQDIEIYPSKQQDFYQQKYQQWQKAVAMISNFYEI